MNKENLLSMPNENKFEMAEVVKSSEIRDFDPDRISNEIARALCEPTERLYRRTSELRNDPFAAMKAVKLTDGSEAKITDPVTGLLIGAAKLQTARVELDLTPKQAGFFDGVMENIKGAAGWASAAAENIKDSIGKIKVSKKALIGAEAAIFALSSSGCAGVIIRPESTPSPIESPVSSFVPSETITPTSEPIHTATVEPTKGIPENPSFFEGVGEIASVEEHEGKWYGIDTIGRAEIVQNDKGEWVKYERPIEFVGYPGVFDSIPKELLEDVDQKNITRLNDNGTPLEWGVVKVDDSPGIGKHFYASGYPLGTYDYYFPAYKQSSKFLLFEVPFRYTRQLLSYNIFAQNTVFSELSVIPASGNIQEVHRKAETYTTLMSMLSNPDIRGHQQVLAFQAGIDEESPMKLGDSLVDGIAMSVAWVQMLSRAWIEESFFPK